MNAGGMDYVKLKPPASTKSYQSAGKLVALKRLDIDTVLSIIDPTDKEFEAMRIGAAIIGAPQTTRGRKTYFPSPCDIIDMELRGYAVFEEPVWRDRRTRWRSTWMLRGVDRLNRLIVARDNSNDLLVAVECPECAQPTIGVVLGPLAVYDDSGAFLDDTSTGMVDLSMACRCKGITVWDIYEFERSAILQCG